MDRLFFIVGSFLGVLGVALGAFGAHALKGHLGVQTSSWYLRLAGTIRCTMHLRYLQLHGPIQNGPEKV